jgi:type 1 glutamine amidotransferase
VLLGCLAAALTAAALVACSSAPSAQHAGAGEPRVLVFTRSTGYRHRSIPAAVGAIARLGRTHGFAVDQTDDEARFTPSALTRYAAVIFVSTTGNPLAAPAHRRAFRRYIAGGGGFLGIHAASDSMYGWRWYVGLVGASFRRHAPGTPAAVVRVEDRRSAATRGLPRAWRRVDEWYAFRADPRPAVHVLASVDEASYRPSGPASMGRDHPIAWCRRYGGGRSVYTAMGHTTGSYREPRFLAHLLGAVEMAAGLAPFLCGTRG